VAGICILVIAGRIIWPDLKFDETAFYLFIFASIVVLIPDIGGIVARIKKVKKGDFEMEFDEKVSLLSEEIEKAESKDKDVTTLEDNDTPTDDSELEERIQRITEQASDPRGAPIVIAVEIEDAIQELAKSKGIANVHRYNSPVRIMDELIRRKLINASVLAPFRDFWTIRNQAAHSARFQMSKYQLYELVEIGIRVLKLIQRANQTS
jgi:hypothetical protein